MWAPASRHAVCVAAVLSVNAPVLTTSFGVPASIFHEISLAHEPADVVMVHETHGVLGGDGGELGGAVGGGGY